MKSKNFLKDYGVLFLMTFLSSFGLCLFQLLVSFISEIYTDVVLDQWWKILVFILLFSLVGILEMVLVMKSRDNSLKVQSLVVEANDPFSHLFIESFLVILFACVLSFLMGLALGAEAPSVFLSASIFLLLSLSFYKETEKKEVIALGASLGFGLAFQNPLAGFLMYLAGVRLAEFKKKPIFKAGFINILGYFFFSLFKGFLLFKGDWKVFGQSFLYSGSFFKITSTSFFTWSFYPWLLLIPVVSSLVGVLYVGLLGGYRKIVFFDNKYSYAFGFLTCFFTVLFLFFFSKELGLSQGITLLGTGASLLSNSASLISKGIGWLFAYLGLRFLLTLFSFNSHYLGGMVIPTIAVGALVGQIVLGLFTKAGILFNETDQLIFVVASMLTFYGMVSGKPFVAFALFFSYGPFVVMALPGLITMAPIALLVLSTKFKGLSYLFNQIDIENGIALLNPHIAKHFFLFDFLHH